MHVLCYEVSRRKWRLVNRKFEQCVSLHVVVNTQLNPKQAQRILRMLEYQNCRSLRLSDWCFEASEVAGRLYHSKSITAVAIQHCNVDTRGLQAIIMSALKQDMIQSWKFGKVEFRDEALTTLAELVRTSQSLRVLEFDCCNLGAQGLAALGHCVAQAQRLHTLAFKSCKLGADDMECLAKGIGQSRVQALNLAFTPLGRRAAVCLGECFKVSSSLQDVNLDFTNVGVHIQPLAEGIACSKTLRRLGLKGNQLGTTGTQTLASAIIKSSLHSVSLYDNNIQQSGAQALGLAIQMAPHLQELQLGSNNVGPQGCHSLAEGIKQSAVFRTLGIMCNGVGAEGAKSLAEALAVSGSLQYLDLSHNQVGLEGAQALSRGIRKSKTLRHLDLDDNNLDDEAMVALAEALGGSNIETLVLASNDLERAGAEALGTAIAAQSALHTLSLKYVFLGDEVIDPLARGLGRSSIRHLDLQGCSIPPSGIQPLAEGVAQARRLETLNLVGNGVGEAGARALAASIARSTSFQSLKVHYGKVGPAGSQALMQAMQDSATFINLQLGSSDVGAPAGHRGVPHPGVTIQPDVERTALEVEHWKPFTCCQCKHLLYAHDERNHIIIFSLDRQGLIQQVMTPDEWHRNAPVGTTVSYNPTSLQGQDLTQFMDHRLAGFYHTLCNLIWVGDMCHIQFQWYCDDADNRREMLTFIYRNNDLLVLSNVTVAETPHQVPVSFIAGQADSLLWRCPFCGWSCCNGGDWMEPEEFYIWLLTEWPALMRDHDFFPVVCSECLQTWCAKYDNAELQEAVRNLGPALGWDRALP